MKKVIICVFAFFCAIMNIEAQNTADVRKNDKRCVKRPRVS